MTDILDTLLPHECGVSDRYKARVVEESLPPLEPLGEDLRVVPFVGEQPAEYIQRVRDTPPDSQSPSDIVPNVAWINPPTA
jgi:hypothetical protein